MKDIVCAKLDAWQDCMDYSLDHAKNVSSAEPCISYEPNIRLMRLADVRLVNHIAPVNKTGANNQTVTASSA